MGACSSKKSKNENNPVSIASIFKYSNNNSNTPVSPKVKSDFYFFTEWILSYKFYTKLYNDDQSTKLITMTGGPNDKNIFKVIKSVDQVDGKDLSDFSNSISLNTLKSDVTKQSRQSFIAKQFTSNSNNPNTISDYELKMNVVNLFEKLCRDKPKKMQKLLFIGPPNNLRWLMWISIARAKYLEIQSKIGINNDQIFNYLINKPFPDDTTEDKIRKDLPRTKTDIKYFRSGNWTLSLFNVLKAIALYDDSLGYCIGMNEIAACALIVSDCNESESFNLLRFMYSSNFGLQLREFYINGFPKLKFYTYFVYELIKERLPKIFRVLEDYKILNEMWLQNWLQNLYSNLFEFSVGVRLWDCIIALGTNFLINFSLGYVKYFEEQILVCRDATEFLEIFKEKNKFKNEKEMIEFREKIIKLSLNFHISQQTYERIEQKYNTNGKKEMLRLTSTTNHLHSNMNEESRANTVKDDNDEVEKMKEILKAINENRATKADINENSQNSNSNQVEEEKGENDQKEINNNINQNSIELQIINENESEEKEEIEKNNIKEDKNFELNHSKKSSSEEIIPEVNIKNNVEITQENVPRSLNEIVNDLNKNLNANNNIIQNNPSKKNDKEINADKNNKSEKDNNNIDKQNISEEDDDDDDSSIIDDLDYDEDADNKIPNSGNEKIKLDETILLHLSQMNMNVKEEQLPKSLQAVKQKT